MNVLSTTRRYANRSILIGVISVSAALIVYAENCGTIASYYTQPPTTCGADTDCKYWSYWLDQGGTTAAYVTSLPSDWANATTTQGTYPPNVYRYKFTGKCHDPGPPYPKFCTEYVGSGWDFTYTNPVPAVVNVPCTKPKSS